MQLALSYCSGDTRLLASESLHKCSAIPPRKSQLVDMTYNVFSGTLNPTQSVNHGGSGQESSVGEFRWYGPHVGSGA